MKYAKYGFNRQVKLLCESACNLAFGYKPKHPSQQTIPHRNEQINNNLLTCESDIAKQVYQQYRQDGFKYADPGITPVAIAQEIQVHLKKKGHLDWRIDEFGKFVFAPTDKYLQQITNNLIKNKRYSHYQLSQCDQSLSPTRKSSTFFDYVISNNTTVSEFYKIMQVQSMAKVTQIINNNHVRRSIVRDMYNDVLSEKLLHKIKYFIYSSDKDQQRFAQIHFNQIMFTSHAQDPQIMQYIGCSGQNTMTYRKLLPNYQLVNNYTGNQNQKIVNVSDEKLVEIIQKLEQQLIKGQISNKYQKFKTDLLKVLNNNNNSKTIDGNVILIFGNLIDQFRLIQTKIMLNTIKDKYVSSQVHDILLKSLNEITGPAYTKCIV